MNPFKLKYLKYQTEVGTEKNFQNVRDESRKFQIRKGIWFPLLFAFALIAANPAHALQPSFPSSVFIEELELNQNTGIGTVELPRATGGDGTVTYTLAPDLPAGMSFNPAELTISGVPTAAIPRTAYTLTATDSDGDSASLAFHITVQAAKSFAPERMPTFRSNRIGEQLWTQDTGVRLSLPSASSTVVSEDSALPRRESFAIRRDYSRSLSYSFSPALPEGVRFIRSSFQLSGTPTEPMPRTEFTMTATDLDGDTGTLTFYVTVRARRGITLSATSLRVEEGGSSTYTVVLNTQPPAHRSDAERVYMVPRSGESGAVAFSPSFLIFTSENWNIPQTVTVSAPEDDDSRDESVIVSHEVRNYYSAAPPIVVSINDNDPAPPAPPAPPRARDGLTIFPASLEFGEGHSTTYTVVLDTAPPRGVARMFLSSDNSDVTVSPGSLIFTPVNWNVERTVTVSAAEDIDGADDTATVSHSFSGYYVRAPGVSVTVRDNDPGVTVSPQNLIVIEGSAETYTVFLNAEPGGDVTITPSSSNGDVTVNPPTLTFTTSNWNIAQTVTVSGAEDADRVNDIATVSHRVSGYGSVTSAFPIAVAVRDNDSAKIIKIMMEKSLAVLGRTVATGAVETISERFSASGSAPGSRMRGIFSGKRMTLSDLKDAAGGGVGAGARTSLSLESAMSETEAEVTIAGGGENEGAVTLWMKGDFRKSEGKFSMEDDPDLSVDAETYSSYLGLDYRLGENLLLGFALSASKSEVKHSGASKGELDVTLASVYPYAHWSPHDGLELWAVAGAGKGEGDLKRDGGDTIEDIGIGTQMFAWGVRQGLLSYRWFDFSAKTDAYAIWVDSDSELESGLESADASVQRLRFALEGRSRDLLSSAAHNFASGVEIGSRLDGGDSGSGLGADVGLSVGYAYIPGNVSVDARGRFLVFHEDSGFRDWGAGLTARVGSGADRGLSLSLSSDWGGESSGGVAKLWENGGKLSSGDGGLDMVPSSISGELGYGLSWRGSGLFEPFAKVGTGSSSRRRVGMGARLSLVGGMLNGLGVELLGEQKQRDKGLADDYRIGITGSVRF